MTTSGEGPNVALMRSAGFAQVWLPPQPDTAVVDEDFAGIAPGAAVGGVFSENRPIVRGKAAAQAISEREGDTLSQGDSGLSTLVTFLHPRRPKDQEGERNSGCTLAVATVHLDGLVLAVIPSSHPANGRGKDPGLLWLLRQSGAQRLAGTLLQTLPPIGFEIGQQALELGVVAQ
jgi:hypothetical protein